MRLLQPLMQGPLSNSLLTFYICSGVWGCPSFNIPAFSLCPHHTPYTTTRSISLKHQKASQPFSLKNSAMVPTVHCLLLHNSTTLSFRSPKNIGSVSSQSRFGIFGNLVISTHLEFITNQNHDRPIHMPEKKIFLTTSGIFSVFSQPIWSYERLQIQRVVNFRCTRWS